MASIWQEQPKLGDFSKIVQVLIETAKTVYFSDGNESRYHAEIDPDKRTKKMDTDLVKIQSGLFGMEGWITGSLYIPSAFKEKAKRGQQPPQRFWCRQTLEFLFSSVLGSDHIWFVVHWNHNVVSRQASNQVTDYASFRGYCPVVTWWLQQWDWFVFETAFFVKNCQNQVEFQDRVVSFFVKANIHKYLINKTPHSF